VRSTAAGDVKTLGMTFSASWGVRRAKSDTWRKDISMGQDRVEEARADGHRTGNTRAENGDLFPFQRKAEPFEDGVEPSAPA
jgi:hypothetical protein